MNKTLGTGSVDRSARVRRIKRVIIGIIALAIILPSVLCIILYIRMNRLEKQILELTLERERVNVITESTMVTAPNKAKPDEGINNSEVIKIKKVEAYDESDEQAEELENSDEDESVDEEIYDNAESEESLESDLSKENQKSEVLLKKVYLTFDDGPSSNTSKILDILNEHNVKGTFFVVGRLSDTTTPMYKRIVDEGHAIGMHSYTHKYKEIYANTDAFVYDLERIQSLIYEQTGVMTKLYRFPGGSSNRVSKTDMSLLIKELDKRDIEYFDWNVVSGDASSKYGLSKEAIVRNCTASALGYEEAVILMHDLPEKATTVEALPQIIEYFENIGVEILPLDENVQEIHHTIDVTE